MAAPKLVHLCKLQQGTAHVSERRLLNGAIPQTGKMGKQDLVFTHTHPVALLQDLTCSYRRGGGKWGATR